VILLARLKEFSRRTFANVFKWALLAYVITSGMIEFAFVRDHTRGSSLVLVSLMLVIFAISVPSRLLYRCSLRRTRLTSTSVNSGNERITS